MESSISLINLSMEDLPAELTIDILSRLPVRTIIHCKRVCKKWRRLVLDSFLVNLHLSRSPTVFIVHENVKCLLDGSIDQGILTWVEIDDKVDHHHLHHEPPMSIDLNAVPIFQNSLIYLMGSVNGLICLRHYSPKHNTYVCNPVTREIMIIPSPQYYKPDYMMIIACGFGVCSLTGEYKVVRTYKRKLPLKGNESYQISVFEAEVYTLGTRQWRKLGRVPYRLHRSHGPFLNDHCHWIVSKKEDAPERICTFDLNTETFQLFPSPPSAAIEVSEYHFQSLTVLKGCLCKSDGNDSQFTIWVMKEYGIKKSWHKEVVITKALNRSQEQPYWYTISLIDGLKDGTIFFVSEGLWAFCPRSDTFEEIDMCWYSESGLAYRPSFLKLQNFESERVHIF